MLALPVQILGNVPVIGCVPRSACFTKTKGLISTAKENGSIFQKRSGRRVIGVTSHFMLNITTLVGH